MEINFRIGASAEPQLTPHDPKADPGVSDEDVTKMHIDIEDSRVNRDEGEIAYACLFRNVWLHDMPRVFFLRETGTADIFAPINYDPLRLGRTGFRSSKETQNN
jgi:hypothetical protein